MYAGYAAFLLKKPHLALEDSGNLEQLRFSVPVSDVIISPIFLPVEFVRNIYVIRAIMKLCICIQIFHPDENIFNYLKINPNEPYVILRFVSWSATHDHAILDYQMMKKEKFYIIFPKI